MYYVFPYSQAFSHKPTVSIVVQLFKMVRFYILIDNKIVRFYIKLAYYIVFVNLMQSLIVIHQ